MEIAGFGSCDQQRWISQSTKATTYVSLCSLSSAKAQRTCRPMSTTYLSDSHIAYRIAYLQNNPKSPESYYRRLIGLILEWNFTVNEGYSVVSDTVSLIPSITVLKLLARPAGSAHEYEFLLGESKGLGKPWELWIEYMQDLCSKNANESRNCYAVLHIGWEVQFFKHENHQFEKLDTRMHLVDDAQNVTTRLQQIKAQPMPFV